MVAALPAGVGDAPGGGQGVGGLVQEGGEDFARVESVDGFLESLGNWELLGLH